MDISENGLQLIIEFEGFSGKLYNDPSENCTIGYGYLVHMGRCNGALSEAPYRNGISEQQGKDLLHSTVQSYVAAVNNDTKVPLTQNQFDALVSFCYNIGTGGYAQSSVLAALNRGDYTSVCNHLLEYIHGSDGSSLPGLVRRRQAECQLFNSQDEEEMWNRLNGIATWWNGRVIASAATDYTMQLATDFPQLPATAKAVDLEVFLSPQSGGTLVFKDGDGSYAGQFSSPGRTQGVIRVVPKDRVCHFNVNGNNVITMLVGVVGYVS